MNTTGKKFGGRQKGTPNKLSSKIKEKLSKLIDEVVASFDIEDMTKSERLKLIQLAMPYVLTKPQQEEVEQQQNITVEIIDRLSDYSDKQLDNAIRNQ
ncbi:hypothetical protein N9P51_01035 [bacterium]|nr:hypothetical protein [bacterium]MDC1416860.1 hypothetical protein [Flavobacteriaceae bacterium]